MNTSFGNDFDQYAKVLLETAIAKDIAALGIADYFSSEGYSRLRSLVSDPARLEALLGRDAAARARNILLLPNIEFRTNIVVVTPRDTGRVNVHVLFSEELEPSVIEQDFLRELRFTSESAPGSPDTRHSLTRENLSALGSRLKQEHPKFHEFPDLFVGMMNAVIDHEQITKVLTDQPGRFRNRFLLVAVPDEDLSRCSWDSQAHLARKVLIQKSDMLFSANPNTRAFALGLKHQTIEAYLKEFRSFKPCIHGSDAHDYPSLFTPAQERHLWVKADPTFHGLQQLLHHPAERVYVGSEPSSRARVRDNATKYIGSIAFQRAPGAKPTEQWFSGEVPLNPGLVAIIGRKGSGKSALADILALVGNTRNSASFSFLTKERFLAPKTALGSKFSARVTWASGMQTNNRRLDESADGTSPELVKYIAQTHLESICSEVRQGPGGAFEREVMDVIFSHVSDADRLGKQTLPDLIEFLTREKEQEIEQCLSDLSELNVDIYKLEEMNTLEHRQMLDQQLVLREAELAAHTQAKPATVPQPNPSDENEAAIAAKGLLASTVTEIEALDKRIAAAKSDLSVCALRVAAADKLLARIANLESQIEKFHAESEVDAKILEIDPKSVVTLTTHREVLEAAKLAAATRHTNAKLLLDPQDENSLTAKRKQQAAQAEVVRAKLDEPNRRYQEYLQQLARWERRRVEISGKTADPDDQAANVSQHPDKPAEGEPAASANPETIAGIKAAIAALDELPRNLEQVRERRLAITRRIYAIKCDLLVQYRNLHGAVQAFVHEHPVAQQQNALEFTATITQSGFTDELLDMIHQGRRGTFQGDEGHVRLVELVARSDFSCIDGVKAFLHDVEESLSHDTRKATCEPTRLRDQLRQGRSPTDVYDYLFGLKYLKPRFELLWSGKRLDHLSPGERGSVLLLFYLLIDKRDCPLIIDQPEENLDNQTTALMLVPALRHAKERRQIVIVTHNPNLAVVCDAEQVIHAELDKSDGNKVSYTSGAIEDPDIARLIVDVLEGTKPAFDLRDAKYQILDTE